MTRKRTPQLIAEICLYGTPQIGAGWLARTADGALLGDGEPKADRTFTDALWLACAAIREAGQTSGTVRVFSPDGQRMAECTLTHPPSYGDLHWQPAHGYVISAEEIRRAAE